MAEDRYTPDAEAGDIAFASYFRPDSECYPARAAVYGFRGGDGHTAVVHIDVHSGGPGAATLEMTFDETSELIRALVNAQGAII